MNEAYKKPLPRLDYELNKPFWAAAREHRLVMPRCDNCGYLVWPPAGVCPECLSQELQWREVAGEGMIWSYGIWHRAFHPGFKPDVPYNVALVELDSGPVIFGNVLGDNSCLRVGARVKAIFDDVTPEVTLVKFELLAATPSGG